MSDSHNYEPNSQDAMFARILQRLDTIDSTTQRIESQAKLTNGRVTALEREKWHQRGVVAGISFTATAVWHWIASRG